MAEIPLWVWILGGAAYLFVGCQIANRLMRGQCTRHNPLTPDEIAAMGVLMLMWPGLILPGILWCFGALCNAIHERRGK